MPALSSTACDLCGLPVIGRPVRGEHGAYCCEGCRRVDEVAREAGIEVGSAGRESEQRRSAAASSRKAAAALAAGARRDTFRVDGMWCASCSLVLVDALMALPGVLDAEVSYAAALARVTRDPERVSRDQVQERFKLLGYSARPASEVGQHANDTSDLFLRLFVSFVLDMWVSWPTWLAIWPGAASSGWGSQQPLELFTAVFSLIVLLFGGWPFLRGAWQAARVGRATMDTLIVLGTWTAWFYSIYALFWGGGPTYFDSASMITVIVLLGRWIEAVNARNTSAAIVSAGGSSETLAWRLPDSSRWSEADAERVDASSLASGDYIVVRPGELSPVDGVVVRGASELDRQRLTGESLPVACGEGDEVWAESLNLSDVLIVRVERVGEATLAGRLSAVVQDAAFARSNTERLVDAISAIFVPAVIVGAVLTAITALLTGSPPDEAVSRAVAVLVVACPCALALATPLAISNATAAAARHGALLRGSPVFERVNDIEIVAFDKTGTLTAGEPVLTSVLREPGSAGRPDGELIALAAHLEAHAPHPVARALARAAGSASATAGGESDITVRRVPGEGLEGHATSGQLWLLGGERLLARHRVSLPDTLTAQAEKAREAGELVVWLAEPDGQLIGFAFADAVRDEAKGVVGSLAKRGIAVAMVSGDASATCEAIAARLGISEVHSEVLPHEKESVVRELQRRGSVAFVGDGLNDAAALAAADLAFGVEGASDAAVAGSDVVLLRTSPESTTSSPLASTLALLDIAAAARRVIRQNLGWAFTYNLVAFPLAASGRLSPIWAAAAMAVSSLAVVGNSLRLRRSR